MTDQELLSLCNERLDYNPDTGVFVRKKYKAGVVTGTKNKAGYIVIGLGGKTHYAHRLAFLITWGYLPKFIDHINGDKSDIRIINLRGCTKSQNGMNRGPDKIANLDTRVLPGFKIGGFHK